MTTLEKMFMRALRLENVGQLDELLAQPISENAALHSEAPDEEYRLADLMYEESDLRLSAQKEFGTLFEGKYVN